MMLLTCAIRTFFPLFILLLPVAAQATCPASAISPYSEITADGDSRHSDPGTVSEGTVLVDASDLKRKKCSGGQWIDQAYDGVNVTSIHPGLERYIEKVFFDRQKRVALRSIGQINCSGSSGTGFLFDLSAFGLPANRNFDLVLTSCHVITNGNCSFRPFDGYHEARPGLESITAQMGPKLGAPVPFTRSISENGCQEFRDGEAGVNRRTARKDWWVGIIERKLPVPDELRIRLVEGDHDLIDRRSKYGDLVTIGMPLKRLKIQMPGTSNITDTTVADMVYSTACKGDLRTDNVVHTCMTYFGMSGGPLGYFDTDGRFSVFGINSWAGGLHKDLGRKQAGQISRGGATALTEDTLKTLRVKIAEFK